MENEGLDIISQQLKFKLDQYTAGRRGISCMSTRDHWKIMEFLIKDWGHSTYFIQLFSKDYFEFSLVRLAKLKSIMKKLGKEELIAETFLEILSTFASKIIHNPELKSLHRFCHNLRKLQGQEATDFDLTQFKRFEVESYLKEANIKNLVDIRKLFDDPSELASNHRFKVLIECDVFSKLWIERKLIIGQEMSASTNRVLTEAGQRLFLENLDSWSIPQKPFIIKNCTLIKHRKNLGRLACGKKKEKVHRPHSKTPKMDSSPSQQQEKIRSLPKRTEEPILLAQSLSEIKCQNLEKKCIVQERIIKNLTLKLQQSNHQPSMLVKHEDEPPLTKKFCKNDREIIIQDKHRDGTPGKLSVAKSEQQLISAAQLQEFENICFIALHQLLGENPSPHVTFYTLCERVKSLTHYYAPHGDSYWQEFISLEKYQQEGRNDYPPNPPLFQVLEVWENSKYITFPTMPVNNASNAKQQQCRISILLNQAQIEQKIKERDASGKWIKFLKPRRPMNNKNQKINMSVITYEERKTYESVICSKAKEQINFLSASPPGKFSWQEILDSELPPLVSQSESKIDSYNNNYALAAALTAWMSNKVIHWILAHETQLAASPRNLCFLMLSYLKSKSKRKPSTQSIEEILPQSACLYQLLEYEIFGTLDSEMNEILTPVQIFEKIFETMSQTMDLGFGTAIPFCQGGTHRARILRLKLKEKTKWKERYDIQDFDVQSLIQIPIINHQSASLIEVLDKQQEQRQKQQQDLTEQPQFLLKVFDEEDGRQAPVHIIVIPGWSENLLKNVFKAKLRPVPVDWCSSWAKPIDFHYIRADGSIAYSKIQYRLTSIILQLQGQSKSYVTITARPHSKWTYTDCCHQVSETVNQKEFPNLFMPRNTTSFRLAEHKYVTVAAIYAKEENPLCNGEQKRTVNVPQPQFISLS